MTTTTHPTIRTSLHVGLPTAEDMAECVAIVATHCPEGATVLPARGVWQGEVEHSAIVTIIHPDSTTWSVRVDALCRHLTQALRQSCALVTRDQITSHTYAARTYAAIAESY